MLADGGAAVGMDAGLTVAIADLVGFVGPGTSCALMDVRVRPAASWTLLDSEGDGAPRDRDDSLGVGATAIGTDTPVLKRAEPEGGGVSACFVNTDLVNGSSCDRSATGVITGC